MTHCNHAMICWVALPESDVSKIIMLQTTRNGIAYQWLDAESDKEAHYFIFFTQISQYFSIREAPSTLNKASWVAMLPQSAQNFVLSPCLVNGLNDVSLFCTWFSSRQSQQVQLLQYYLRNVTYIHHCVMKSRFNSSSLLLVLTFLSFY